MLTTYARRKFRQYAPVLFFLQLFFWLIYFGFASANCSTNSNYAIHLQNNNRQNWEQLSWKVLVFDREVQKHKRGEEYLVGVKMFENLAVEYRTQIKVLSDEATMVAGLAFSDRSPEQKEEVLVQIANKNNWKLQLHEIMQNYHAELEAGINYTGYILDTSCIRALKGTTPSFSNLFDVSKLGHKFQTQNETLSALAMADMIVINSTFTLIDCITSRVSFGSCGYDKYLLIFNADSKAVYQGDSLKADVFLTKSSSMARPTIVVDDEILPLDVDGIAKFKKPADKLGKHKIKASISVKDEFGNRKVYTDVYEYTVLPKCK
ncbi:MAG: hypothetical protein ACPGVB_03835 [Chitinophagales bacterium]